MNFEIVYDFGDFPLFGDFFCEFVRAERTYNNDI